MWGGHTEEVRCGAFWRLLALASAEVLGGAGSAGPRGAASLQAAPLWPLVWVMCPAAQVANSTLSLAFTPDLGSMFCSEHYSPSLPGPGPSCDLVSLQVIGHGVLSWCLITRRTSPCPP